MSHIKFIQVNRCLISGDFQIILNRHYLGNLSVLKSW